MRRLAVLVCLLPACFNPGDSTGDTENVGSTGTTGTGGPTTNPGTTESGTTEPGTTSNPTDSSTTDEPSSSTDPTDPGSSTTGEASSSSTTDFVPGCDNGVVEDDELCFEDAVELDTLVSTQGVTVADLDDDGHLDVIVGDYGDGTTGGLYVYLGAGDGTFSDAISTENSQPLIRVAAGAIADGTMDVVAMNASSTAGVLRFRGNGDGSFSTISNYAGASDWDVALGDLNGDDRLDLIGTTPSIDVRFANASEGFGSAMQYGNTNGFQCVKTVDIDNDGDLDVFGCSFDGIYPLINDGGTLTPGAFFGQASNDILVGDFDGDGNADLAGTAGSTMHVYFGDGSGGFEEGPEISVNSSPIAGKSVDIDEDGYDDLIVVNTSGTTSVVLSNGDRSFQSQQLFTMLDGYLYDMDMGDLNEDGAQDIVTVSPNGGPVQLLLSHI
jgi:hypothetical protein